VTCREDLPSGRAYVSFDELGDAEAALERMSKGGAGIHGLVPSTVIAR
jgi:hypothetical protein